MRCMGGTRGWTLTLEQMQTIERVIRKIMGDWTH